MAKAFIALGSNLNNPIEQIHHACTQIDQTPHIQLIQVAHLYKNPPVGLLDQPDFVNTAAMIETTLSPQALLNALLDIEKHMGRVRNIRFGPRIIDLDIILYETRVIDEPGLCIPHPSMKQREFVLWPLYDLAPDLVLPDGTSLEHLVKGNPETLTKLEQDLSFV